jgi:hypothetical protein
VNDWEGRLDGVKAAISLAASWLRSLRHWTVTVNVVVALVVALSFPTPETV